MLSHLHDYNSKPLIPFLCLIQVVFARVMSIVLDMIVVAVVVVIMITTVIIFTIAIFVVCDYHH